MTEEKSQEPNKDDKRADTGEPQVPRIAEDGSADRQILNGGRNNETSRLEEQMSRSERGMLRSSRVNPALRLPSFLLGGLLPWRGIARALSRAARMAFYFVIAGHSRSQNGVTSFAYAGNPCGRSARLTARLVNAARQHGPSGQARW